MTLNHRWFWLAIIVIFSLLLYLLAPILTPFIMGALLAYLGDPIVDRLEKRIPRSLAVSLVFFIFFIVLLIIILIAIPILETQIKYLNEHIPNYIESITATLQPYINRELSIDTSMFKFDKLTPFLDSNWTGGLMRSIMSALSHSSMIILAWVANVALTPVIVFYMLRDWDYFISYIHDMIPRNIEPVVKRLAFESDKILASFLRGQLSVMMSLSLIYAIGLWLIGLDIALLAGVIAGIVSFVPYLGLIVGVLVAGSAMLLQTGQSVDLGLVFLVFIIAQMIEGMLLTPLLVGKNIGLHPVTIIFAVLAGGQLFGFFGILLALPVAAVLAVILRHLHHSYKESQIYQL